MKKVGTAYLHHREISAQEAVYRVTGMHLKECSRKVEFIPVGENPCRMSIPLKEVKKKLNKNTSETWLHNENKSDITRENSDLWMTNSIDRYKGRPNVTILKKCVLQSFVQSLQSLMNRSYQRK